MIRLEQLARNPREAERATLDQPLDHLVACHNRIEERLRTLERIGESLDVRRQEAMEALDACFRFFEANGVWHTADEEESVFPRLRSRLTPEERAYLEGLENQHQEADQIYAELKSVAAELRRQPDGEALTERYRRAAGRFCQLYRSHITSENETLIALGRRVLKDSELAAIAREMKQRRGLAT